MLRYTLYLLKEEDRSPERNSLFIINQKLIYSFNKFSPHRGYRIHR